MGRKHLALIRIWSETNSRLHMVDRDQFFIGRSNESDVMLAEPSVSRKHVMIELSGTDVFITDLSSSNGSFIGDQMVTPNKKHHVAPGMEVRLGRSLEVIKFEVIERPIEFTEYQDRLPQFTKALDKVSESMLSDIEARVNKEVEAAKQKMLIKVNEEVEQIKKGEAQALQVRIEQEVNKQREKIREDLSDYRSEIKAEAVNEAEEILLEAHNEVLKLRVDYAEEYRKFLEDAQNKSGELVKQAEEKAEKLMQQAREMNDKFREKTRKEQEELFEKARVQNAELTANAQKEAEAVIERAKASAAKEEALSVEYIKNEIKRMKQDARDEIKLKRKEHTEFFKQCEQLEKDLEKLRSEKVNLNDAISEKTHELKALTEENERQADLNKQLEKLNDEIKQLDVRKVQMQEENVRNESMVADLQKKRIEELDKACADKEKQLANVIGLKAQSIAQKVEQTVLKEVADKWPESKKHLSDISRKVSDDLMSILAADTFDKTGRIEKSVGPKFFQTRAFRWGAIVGFIAVFAALYQNSKEEVVVQQQFTEKLIEKQKEEARFKPEMNLEYRETYTENIIYNVDYLKLKMDDKIQNQWALNLNEFFLKRLKLSEEDMVRFIGLESAMIKRLVKLRDAIDARHLEEGLQRMRDAENEDKDSIVRIMTSDKNYQKLRDQEKRFLEDMRAQPELRAPANKETESPY